MPGHDMALSRPALPAFKRTTRQPRTYWKSPSWRRPLPREPARRLHLGHNLSRLQSCRHGCDHARQRSVLEHSAYDDFIADMACFSLSSFICAINQLVMDSYSDPAGEKPELRESRCLGNTPLRTARPRSCRLWRGDGDQPLSQSRSRPAYLDRILRIVIPLSTDVRHDQAVDATPVVWR